MARRGRRDRRCDRRPSTLLLLLPSEYVDHPEKREPKLRAAEEGEPLLRCRTPMGRNRRLDLRDQEEGAVLPTSMGMSWLSLFRPCPAPLPPVALNE